MNHLELRWNGKRKAIFRVSFFFASNIWHEMRYKSNIYLRIRKCQLRVQNTWISRQREREFIGKENEMSALDVAWRRILHPQPTEFLQFCNIWEKFEAKIFPDRNTFKSTKFHYLNYCLAYIIFGNDCRLTTKKPRIFFYWIFTAIKTYLQCITKWFFCCFGYFWNYLSFVSHFHSFTVDWNRLVPFSWNDLL